MVPITDEEAESQKSLCLIMSTHLQSGDLNTRLSPSEKSLDSLMLHNLSSAWVPCGDASLWSVLTLGPCCWGAVALIIEHLCWLLT